MKVLYQQIKGKDMIILKSKMNDTMEKNIYIRINCVYYEKNNNVI